MVGELHLAPRRVDWIPGQARDDVVLVGWRAKPRDRRGERFVVPAKAGIHPTQRLPRPVDWIAGQARDDVVLVGWRAKPRDRFAL